MTNLTYIAQQVDTMVASYIALLIKFVAISAACGVGMFIFRRFTRGN